MAGINSLLTLGRSALNASQVAISVTGSNISNVDTKGYSTQTTNLTTDGTTGGVNVDSVTRSYDAFVEAQYLDKIAARDLWQVLYQGLSGVESLFNESNTNGVSSALSTMFSDWTNLTSSTASNASITTMTLDANGSSLAAGSQFFVQPSTADISIAISGTDSVVVNGVGKDIFGGVYQARGNTNYSVAQMSGSNAGNLFETVGELIGYLETNNEDGISASLDKLTASQNTVLEAAAAVGGKVNRVDATKTMTENNLEHSIDPEKNASPEQLRFMVALAPDQIYAPCTEEMLAHLAGEGADPGVLTEYAAHLDRVLQLIDAFVPDAYTREKIRVLCEFKYRQALVKPTLIPSRLGKRLLTIFLTQSGLDDPYRERKRAFNRRAFARIQDEAVKAMLLAPPRGAIPGDTIAAMRHRLDCLELARLLALGTDAAIWEREDWRPDPDALERDLAGLPEAFEALAERLDPRRQGALKILFLPDVAGGLLFDLLAARTLVRLGHRVIMV